MFSFKINFMQIIFIIFFSFVFILGQENKMKSLDEKVEAFLDSRKGTWDDWNVPEYDGKRLHDLIVEHKYTSVLEIGTSTGHSTIWIAWALSKIGGKVITIEIDEKRYKEALANFEKAGVAEYIDARLADAHQLVKELEGPFDFVFSDADKEWYTNYFKDVYPKLRIGGCFTAHNISDSYWSRIRDNGTYKFYKYVKSLPDMETALDSNGNGLSVSFKRALK